MFNILYVWHEWQPIGHWAHRHVLTFQTFSIEVSNPYFYTHLRIRWQNVRTCASLCIWNGLFPSYGKQLKESNEKKQATNDRLTKSLRIRAPHTNVYASSDFRASNHQIIFNVWTTQRKKSRYITNHDEKHTLEFELNVSSMNFFFFFIPFCFTDFIQFLTLQPATAK